jgi:hypothetical protein
MTIIDEVDEVTYVPVDKDKLKEDQQKELREAVDMNVNVSSHTAPPDLETWSRSSTFQSSSP